MLYTLASESLTWNISAFLNKLNVYMPQVKLLQYSDWEKKIQQPILYFRMYLYFQRTQLIGQCESAFHAFHDKMFWVYMHSDNGFPSWHVYTFAAEAYDNIECMNIATRWACLDIPSQWFTSQSVWKKQE